MGWIFAILFGTLAFAALSLSGRCSRLALEIVAAAILIGIAGYGWQGSPAFPGHPVSAAR